MVATVTLVKVRNIHSTFMLNGIKKLEILKCLQKFLLPHAYKNVPSITVADFLFVLCGRGIEPSFAAISISSSSAM